MDGRLAAVAEQDVVPIGAYRMPPAGRDRVLRRGRRRELVRLVHVGDEPALVAAWPTGGAVRIQGRAATGDAAAHAVSRMRFALGLDHDLAPFHEEFRRDRLIGHVIRRMPWVRPLRRPEPFEALAWAITEQLIDFPRASAIQRRIVFRLGRRCDRTGLRDLPSPRRLSLQAPAFLQSLDLSAGRSLALVRCQR